MTALQKYLKDINTSGPKANREIGSPVPPSKPKSKIVIVIDKGSVKKIAHPEHVMVEIVDLDFLRTVKQTPEVKKTINEYACC